jgi:hypothetical protein
MGRQVTYQSRSMRGKVAALCIALAAATWTTTPLAHHSISMVEISTPVWVKGAVVEFHARHPHVMIKLEVKDRNGRTAQWDIEGPNLARLARMGAGADFLKAGDVIEVCGFHLKQPRYKPDFIHGQVLVMPDGHMRHFGPYGKLENCIRPADSAQRWVSFLQADPLAMRAWCESHKYVRVPSVAPAGMVAAIDRQVGNPCR